MAVIILGFDVIVITNAIRQAEADALDFYLIDYLSE